MKSLLHTLTIFILCLCWLSPTTQAKDFRNWKQFPAVLQVDQEADLYVIGDVHGDKERLLNLLFAAKLVPDKSAQTPTWSGGKNLLVLTGDLISKGDSSIGVILYLRELQNLARKAGGKVVITTGNHEVEFLRDPTESKLDKFNRELKKRNIDPEDVVKGKDRLGIGQFLNSLPFAARVNDWFFVHAGLETSKSLNDLNLTIQSQVNENGMDARILLSKKAKKGMLGLRMPKEISKKKAPWWHIAEKDSVKNHRELNKRVTSLGTTGHPVNHLAFGHQAGKYEIQEKKEGKQTNIKRKAGTLFPIYKGLAVMVDTGFSRGVGKSEGAVLWVRQGTGQMEIIDHNGHRRLLMIE